MRLLEGDDSSTEYSESTSDSDLESSYSDIDIYAAEGELCCSLVAFPR